MTSKWCSHNQQERIHQISTSVSCTFLFFILILVISFTAGARSRNFLENSIHDRFLCHVKYVSASKYQHIDFMSASCNVQAPCVGAAAVVHGQITAMHGSCIFINRKQIHHNQSTLPSIFVTPSFISATPNGVTTPRLGTAALGNISC